MRSILFVITEPGEFVELKNVAIAAKEQNYHCGFLFTQTRYINLKQDCLQCELQGFETFYPKKPWHFNYKTIEKNLENGYIPYSFVSNQSRHPKWISYLLFPLIFLAGILASLLYPFRRVFRKSKLNRSYWTSFYCAKKAFHLFKPSLVVFGQEFAGSHNTFLTKLSKKNGVPTLLIPFAVCTVKEIVESLYDKPEFEVGKSYINRLAAFIYPHWINYYKGKKLLRLPGKQIFLLEAAKLAPQHPWVPNYSKVTRIAVESPKMLDYFRKMRFPEEQLCLTGALCDDILAKGKALNTPQSEFSGDLNLDPHKKILLCAWPTNQFSSRKAPMEYKNYAELCNAWAKSLSLIAQQGHFSIIIRPHPVTNPELLFRVLSQYNLHDAISYRDTIELMNLADLFIASVSSTLRWAISKGIPAVNYDCYQYGYTDFDAQGVYNVCQYKEFINILNQLCGDINFYDAAKKRQAESAAEWGLLDGKSKERILHLIDQLFVNNPPKSLKYEHNEPSYNK